MHDLLRVSIGQHSMAGVKAVNQDFHGAADPPQAHLRRSKGVVLALADGISSSRVSQEASAAAVHGFLQDYFCTSEAWPVRRAAQCVLEATNAWLYAQNRRSDARFDPDRGYVCTFSALILKGREAHLLHVGDTRIYRLHPQALEQLSEDHRQRGSSAEIYLGRALGVRASVEIDYRRWDLEPGEHYLLATDGAYEHLDTASVWEALHQHPQNLDAAAAQLTRLALARGSQDNLTVQLLRIDALPSLEEHPLQAQRETLRLPALLQPGERFEGYEVLRELHASSRSHVYLVRDEASGKMAVLKLPSVDLREQPAYLDQFLLEEWVAQRLNSPHMLKPFAAERPRQHLFVAMSYVEGQTLTQWMTDHPRPDLDAVRRLVSQAALALQAFHGREMLHQDVRPDNLMIDASGTVKLIDFAATHVAGLAEGSTRPQADQVVGALQYVAPEYFWGEGGSAASDLFSLAVITYQMLTGQLPYGLQVPQIRSEYDTRRLHYVPLRQHRPDLPDWLDAVLRKALHPQPYRRQQAASELIHDLHHPSAEFQRRYRPPIIERDPVRFWQLLSLLLGLSTLVLLGLRINQA